MVEQLPPTKTARDTLRAIAVLAAADLRPVTRAIGTATMLDQLAAIGGELPLTTADLVAGLVIVAQPALPVEADQIAQRRTTCAQLIGLLFARYGDDCKHGDAMRWATVLDAVIVHFSGSVDPSHAVIREFATWQTREIKGDRHGG